MQHEIEKIRNSSFSGKMKFLLKDFAIYGVVGMMSRLMGLFLIPVIARIFEPAEYGVVDNIRVVYEIIIALSLLGLNQAVGVFVFQTENSQERRAIAAEGMIVSLMFCLLVCTILFFNADNVLSFFSIPRGTRTLEFRLMLLTLPFTLITVFVQQLLKWNFKRFQYMLVSLGGPVILVAATLVYILKLDLGLAGVFYGQLTSSFIVAVAGFFFCSEYFALPKKFVHLKEMLHFSWPLMTVSLLSSFMPAIDRKIISANMSSTDVGTYALGDRFSRLINIVSGGFSMAWGPFALSINKEKDAAVVYSRVFTLHVVALTAIGFFVLSVSQPLVVFFASVKYLNSLQIIPFLLFGLIAESFQEVLEIGILTSKKTIYNILSFLVQLIVSTSVMLLLVQPYGIVGVGVGFMCGKLAFVISKYIFSTYASEMKIPVFKELLVFLAAITVILCIENAQLGALLKGCLYAFTGLMILIVGMFVLISKVDRANVFEKIKNRKLKKQS